MVETLRNCGARLMTLELLFPEDGIAARFNPQTNTILKAYVVIHSDRELRMVRENLLNLTGITDFYVE